jgi:UDP-N-acetylglucosamine--N-acetylmuramyl-(pentapeptide) pyrophosphoryl-undecaprenol N-acetylglucosamine transferase
MRRPEAVLSARGCGVKIVIACGASGGHIFPGIALAQEITRTRNSKALIVCSDKPIDIEILKKSGCEFTAMRQNPFIYGGGFSESMRFGGRLAGNVYRSVKLLKREKAGCVVGFGGFASGPVVIAAWLLRIPRIIHEQNVVAGMANRIGAAFANRVAVSFEETIKFFGREKSVKVGNPVRGSFIFYDKQAAREGLGLKRDKFTVLVTGGSQGAASVNDTVFEALVGMSDQERDRFQVIHITGAGDYDKVAARYARKGPDGKVCAFLDEMDKAYSAADLVISRAGATTVAELTHFGKPSVLIPYPKESVHQRENALFLSDNGAAVMIEDKDLDPSKLKGILLDYAGDPEKLMKISASTKKLASSNAASLLADEIAALSGRGHAQG